MKAESAMDSFAKSSRLFLVLALCVIVLYWLPYLVLWKKSHILIHDNLDSIFVWYKLLLDSGHLFSSNSTMIEPFMGGLPRSSFPTEFNFTSLWFLLFHPLAAYVFERLLISVTAYLGMYLLLTKHIIPGYQHSLIQTGVALTFGLLPFWPFGGLSVAGLPFLMYAFLNVRSGEKHLFSWLIIVIYPFYASLPFTGVFVIATIMLLLVYDSLRNRCVNWNLALGVGLICLLFILTHYRLFYSFLIDSKYISLRHEFGPVGDPQGFKDSIKLSIEMFILGQYHARSLQGWVIVPSVFLGLLLMWEFRRPNKVFMAILFVLVVTSLFYGFWGSEYLAAVKHLLWSLMPIQLQRFHWLHPLFWSMLFAMSLLLIEIHLRVGKYLVYVFLGLQLLYVFSHHEILRNRLSPTFEEFFAEAQFQEIKNYIGYPLGDYRVVSIGIHPSISQYNGFYTLDGYSADYPLSYKHQFRRIIAPELEKNQHLRSYFDNWGARAYIMPAQDIGYVNRKYNDVVLNKLELNIATLKAMGGKYIISAVRIDTTNNPEYILDKVFRHEKSAWEIYLYNIAGHAELAEAK